MTLVTSTRAKSRTCRRPPPATVSVVTFSAWAESGSTSTHLTATLLSTSQSVMTAAAGGDLGRTVGQNAVIGKQLTVEITNRFQPRLETTRFGRLYDQPDALIVGQGHLP